MAVLKKIEDERYISNLFRNLSKRKEVPATLVVGDKKLEAIMCFSLKKGNEPFLKLEQGGLKELVSRDAEVNFCNGDAIFLFQTKILSIIDNECDIERPKTIFSSFRRMLSRYSVNDDEMISVHINELDCEYAIKNISTGGLCLVSEGQAFEVGMVLRNMNIKLGTETEVIADAVVRHSLYKKGKSFVIGLRFVYMSITDLGILRCFLISKAYPNIHPAYEFTSEDIWKLVEKSGLIKKAYAEKAWEYFLNGYEMMKIVMENPLIGCSFVQYKENDISALASVIRIFDRTFLGQQLITDPEIMTGTKSDTDIYLAIADFMLSNAYCDHYIKYIEADLTWHHELLLNIEGIINDSEKFKLDKMVFFECKVNEMRNLMPSGRYVCEALYEAEEFIELCKRDMKPLEIGCYGYEESQQFFLDEISQIYQAVGLNASRRLWRVMRDGITVAYAVAEEYPEEFNIISVVNACRVYFTIFGADIKETFNALLPELEVYYRRSGKERFYLLIKAWEKVAKDIALPGVTYRSVLGRVMMDREGLSEYKKLLMDSFVHHTRYYPLTHPQLAIWYTEKVYPGTSFGNIASYIKLKGKVDYFLLETAINHVIQKTDGIRLHVVETDGVPRQYVSSYKYIKVEFIDFSVLGGEESFQTWSNEKNQEAFSLIDSDLFYFSVYKINENNGGVYIKTHHLVSDGWSAIWIINKIMEYYSKLKNGIKISRRNKPSYLEYIQNEEEFKYSRKFSAQKGFWDKKFSSIPDFVSLKPIVSGYRNTKAERKSYVLSKELTTRMYRFCEETKISPFTVFLSSLYIYINRVTSKEDIVIGTPVINRSTQREKETFGMYVSMVPVRMSVDTETDFISYISSVSKEWMLILKNQKYPYDLVQKDYRERHKVLDNLFDIVISYQNAKIEVNELTGDYEIKWCFNGSQIDSLQIHISDWGSDGQYELNFDYLVDIFDEQEIDEMFSHYINILKDGIENPTKILYKLEMLSDEEKKKILFDFNNTKSDYPRHKTIHQIFEEQADEESDSVAVVFGKRQITYRELNSKANQLANILRGKGVKQDTIVGLMAKRSIEMVIGTIAILKAGGAYLPIESKYPPDRKKFMLEDSNANLLLSACDSNEDFGYNGEIIDLNNPGIFSGDDGNLQSLNTPNDMAYVIYTSGSTGIPKGTVVEHMNVVRLVKNTNYIIIGKEDRILQTGSISFDASTFEIWGSLLNGSRLYLVDDNTILDVDRLSSALKKYNITVLWLTSPLFNQLSQQNPYMFDGLKYLLVGGDVLSPRHINNVRRTCKQIRIVNGYGPTENTTFSTCFLIDRDYEENIPIGKPISNSTAYIINKNNCLQPIGVPGELCVGGDGVARGYLNRDELTKEKFIPNPFIEGERVYKTGDLVRWLPDGNIEFIGRIDNQVKIRGFRIEPGEIEIKLLNLNAIKDAVVISKTDHDGKKYLCAYYVADKEIKPMEIREYLLRELPEYMVPSSFVSLEKMPLNANGKIDRKALPDPDSDFLIDSEYVAPQNEEERILSEIWSKVLNVERIGTNDNFFELGGDSISAIQVSAGLQKFNMAINMQDIFKCPTIGELCNCIKRSEKKVEQGAVIGEVHLTPIQKWFFECENPERQHYNQYVTLHNKNGFDVNAIKKAFDVITKHHDALRMVYNTDGNNPVQINRDANGEYFGFKFMDLTSIANYSETIKNESLKLQKSINLSEGPLVQLGLFRTSDGDHLIIIIHHLVVDGVSWRVILEDFALAYEQASASKTISLQDKTDSFMIWSEKLYQHAESLTNLKQTDYWKRLEDEHIALLPKDSTISSNTVADSREVLISLSTEYTEKLLKDVNRIYNTEINDILLTALGLSVKEWTGCNKVLINLEGHGREKVINDIDVTRTVGWFTSAYPVVLDVTKSEDLGYLIKTIKEKIKKIPDKGIGYGILKYITPQEKRQGLKFRQKPEISFNYLGQLNTSIEISNLGSTEIVFGFSSSSKAKRQFVIDINGMVSKGVLTFFINYNQNEYKESTMASFASYFKNHLERIIEHCISKDEVELTPTDLGDSSLSLEELDEISKMVLEL